MTTQKSDSVAAAKYATPPKRVFRKMGLGVIQDGYIRCVAGFRFRWWAPDFCGPVEPIIVKARVLRLKATPRL